MCVYEIWYFALLYPFHKCTIFISCCKLLEFGYFPKCQLQCSSLLYIHIYVYVFHGKMAFTQFLCMLRNEKQLECKILAT